MRCYHVKLMYYSSKGASLFLRCSMAKYTFEINFCFCFNFTKNGLEGVFLIYYCVFPRQSTLFLHSVLRVSTARTKVLNMIDQNGGLELAACFMSLHLVLFRLITCNINVGVHSIYDIVSNFLFWLVGVVQAIP